jgi:hypothetical protein
MSNLLILILVLMLAGALPLWPYSSNWGYFPGSGVGLILLIAVIVSFTNRRTLN